jgi:CheY-like chemotaxis protein
MGEAGTAGRNKNYILVVDNNVDDRFQTGMVLQRFGYNICTASSAAVAIDFIHVAPPAAIVSEGGMTGTSLASRIRKDQRFSHIPVMLLTAARDLDLEVRARKGEFAACLTKPLDVEKFYQAIQAAIEKTPRKNIRIDASLEAKLENVAEGEKGLVTVLSEYGLFFLTEEPQPLNKTVTVSFTVNGRTITVEAVVLYSYSLEASPFRAPGMGMKFVKISPDDQAFIKSFILEKVQGDIARQDPQKPERIPVR